jgi:hypothetical protein
VSAEQLPGTGGLEVVVAGRRHVVPPARRFVVGRGAGVDLDPLVEFVDVGGNAFEADGLTVTTPKGKTLLHSVGFALPGKTLMAVIGPSGAGKSTLLGALIGSRPADRGTVRYAGRGLYRDYDELRHRIALVPQDDVPSSPSARPCRTPRACGSPPTPTPTPAADGGGGAGRARPDRPRGPADHQPVRRAAQADQRRP